MIVSKDVEKFLNDYIDSLCFLGKLQIGAIKEMVDYKGQGSEYVSCSFDPKDEDFRAGYVTLYFWKPAAEEDTMVFVENERFFNALFEISERCMKDEAQKRIELDEYLNKLRTVLNISK